MYQLIAYYLVNSNLSLIHKIWLEKMRCLIILLFFQNVLPFPTEFCEPLMPNDWKISKNGKETTFRSHFGYSNLSLFILYRRLIYWDIITFIIIWIATRKIHGKITRTIFNRTKLRATFEIDGPIKIERFAWKKCNVHAKRSVSKSDSMIATQHIAYEILIQIRSKLIGQHIKQDFYLKITEVDFQFNCIPLPVMFLCNKIWKYKKLTKKIFIFHY